MNHITVFPLKGFTFENHTIYFGSTRQEVAHILGEPDESFPPPDEIDDTYLEFRGTAQFEYTGECLTSICIPFHYTVFYNDTSLEPDFGKALMQRKPVTKKCKLFSPLRWGYIEEAGLLFRYNDHRCYYLIQDNEHFHLSLQGLELLQECKLKALNKENGKDIEV